MKVGYKLSLISLAVMSTLATGQVRAEEVVAAEKNNTPSKEDTLPEVKVTSKAYAEVASEQTKSYAIKKSASATRLDTSIKEIPQSISVITRQQLDDFGIKTVNDALDMATGIKVERLETDRTVYTARGSEVTNFQIDGIGTPMVNGLEFGDIDLATYDRIEVLRGANGLLTGTGNPSATINFVRKRPTLDFQANVDATVGSWDSRRLDVDVSTPLNADGSIRGRLVAANLNKNSYLDRYRAERNVVYGIIEADLTDKTTVAFGHTYQQNDASGNNWGSSPLLYSDNTKRHYKRSDSTGTDWTHWNVKTNITFGEVMHQLNNDWSVKAQVSRKETSSDASLFYIFGNESKSGAATLFSFPGQYRDSIKDLVADVYVKGPFELGGRQHELVVGVNWSETTSEEAEKVAAGGAFSNFDDIGNTPKPTFVSSGNFVDVALRRTNGYAAAKLNATDDLKVTVGASMLSYDLSGFSYGVEQKSDATNKVTPYIGAVYDLTKEHALYASYTGIYNPQTDVDASNKPLTPLEGKNYEVGVKSDWLDKKLNTSFALFKTVQENLAQATGQKIGIRDVYEGIDAKTKGYELDLSGELSDRLNVSAGYTRLFSIRGTSGENVKPYTPRQMAHVSTAYKVPAIEKLKIGASVNWQSALHEDPPNSTFTGTVRYKQGSYATLNLMTSYEFDKHWSAAVNLYNVTNEKYLASFQSVSFGQGYYAAPLNGLATLSYKY